MPYVAALAPNWNVAPPSTAPGVNDDLEPVLDARTLKDWSNICADAARAPPSAIAVSALSVRSFLMPLKVPLASVPKPNFGVAGSGVVAAASSGAALTGVVL